jgi:succinyl-diaminopimelate desuccinylase
VIKELLERARADAASVTELASALIRRPSRGGIDPYEPVLEVLEGFMASRGLARRRLHDHAGALAGSPALQPGK